jgi:hypothetical protein
MKDPKLFVHEGASDFERRWLSAARVEEPPADVVRKIETALGIGAAALVVPGTANAATSAAKGGLSALRIAGLSALGVGGAIGLVLLLSRPAAPPPPEERPQATGSVPVVPVAPAGTGTAQPASGPALAPSADTAKGTAPGPGALRDEITLIDGARSALAAGSPTRALALLERYRAQHPRGMLRPEALAMRIEAIDRSGDHTRARALARAFLAEYPNSPLAQRVAQLGRE